MREELTSRNCASKDLISLASIVSDNASCPDDFTEGLSHWLAVVQSFQFAQVFGISVHQIRQFEQQSASLGRVQGTPFRIAVERFLSGLNGKIYISLEDKQGF